jgi:non-heme chloroperoxidase
VPFYGANRSGSTVSQGLRDTFWWWSMQVGLKGAYDCIEAFSETDLTEDLRRIDVPTLIVHGDDDQIVPIDASARRSVELVSGATLKVYPGAPHGLAQVAPHKNQFNTDLLAFLKAEPPTCTAGLPWSGSADAVHGAIRRSIGAVGLGCGA